MIALNIMLILALTSFARSTLFVSSPKELLEELSNFFYRDRMVQKNGKFEIPAEILNLGLVQYGKKIIGISSLSQPLDACNPSEFNNQSNTTFQLVIDDSCSREEKVYYVQQQKATEVAIIFEPISYSNKNVTQLDNIDDLRENLNITTLLIANKFGKFIRKYLENGFNVTFEFDVYQKQVNTPKVFLKLQIFNMTSLRMMKSIFKIRDKLYFIDLLPIYSLPMIQSSKVGNKDADCLFLEGFYICTENQSISIKSDDIIVTNTLSGKEIAKETIRQLCMFKYVGEVAWRNYMNLFAQNCWNLFNYEDCVQNYVIPNMNNSTNFKEWERCTQSYNNVKNMLFKNRMFEYLPNNSLWIDDLMYHGRFEEQSIFRAICSSSRFIGRECSQHPNQ